VLHWRRDRSSAVASLRSEAIHSAASQLHQPRGQIEEQRGHFRVLQPQPAPSSLALFSLCLL
jgi:hypothetical protein